VKPKNALITFAACAMTVLGVPAVASAEIIELGAQPATTPPSCPAQPCLAVSRTTGYQAKVGPTRGLMTVPKTGRLVAWTIALGNPGRQQTEFFDERLGGESKAQITVLDPRARLRSQVMAHGTPRRLAPYFGSTVQFALTRSIRVRKGWVVALTVPTWAPALSVGLGADTSWRASRARGDCEDTQAQTAQLDDEQVAQYFCLYRTARLTYTATLIPDAQRMPTSAG
jgi:hypothetical protein